MKKQMLDERRFPQMHLDLQRLLQVIAHGEQVFPRVKDKWGRLDKWSAVDDIATLDVLVGRLRKLKENVGFIANRITAIQAGLNSWQSEQINRKLYYLSFLSIIFLPLSIVTGGMYVVLSSASSVFRVPSTHCLASRRCCQLSKLADTHFVGLLYSFVFVTSLLTAGWLPVFWL